MRFTSVFFLSAVVAWGGGCTTVDYEDFWMDSPSTQDPAVDDPDMLTSTDVAATDVERQRPVLVMTDGFSGSTYNFVELTAAAEARGIRTSNVLLGGHGRSLDAWSATTWRDWAAPLVDELRALDAAGYENIHVLPLSASASMLLIHLAEGDFDDLRPWRSLMLTAPFVVPADKSLYNLRNGGQLYGNFPDTGFAEAEKAHVYVNRPYVVVDELLKLLETFEATMAAGNVPTPEGTDVHILQATADEALDATGPLLLQEQLAAPATLHWFDTNEHTLLRTHDKDDIDDDDIVAQQQAFALIFDLIEANSP